MRLIYICSDFGIDPAGVKGASIHVRAITGALARTGCDVRLLSPKGDAGPGHAALPLSLPAACASDHTARALKRWLTTHDEGDELAKDLRPLLYQATARVEAIEAARAFRPAAIVERLSLMGCLGMDIATALEIPLLVEVNALLSDEAAEFRSLALRETARRLENRVLAAADAIIAVSAPLAERIAARGVDRSRIHVVPNGVDLELFNGAPSRETCRQKLGLADQFVVAFAGSLKPWHGVDVLLEAFARLNAVRRDARLLIVGTGPMQAALHEQAARLGMANAVEFTGAVPHQDVPALLRAVDVAVAPFRRVDGFYFSPIKLFEYMAAGACVVASRLGQIAEVIDDGVNGLLCEPDDPPALHAALLKAADSPALRARLAARADACVRERYTWDHAAATTLDIVQSVLHSHAGYPGAPQPPVALAEAC